ncbi:MULTISPECIES: TnsA-like heteromeric transposase endonuclease subunit [Streptomyces]|uniref:TnsA-like heteromeric transposase endonuclease subunit n=1 Tax=Streptomyces TaxID=1883 RepID=UPI00367C5710
MTDSTTTFSVRLQSNAVVEDQGWATASLDLLRSASPWRTFRWYRGQRHFSGSYWSTTTQKHVIYESRLELSRLVYADFDPAVLGIVAQPFLLKAVLEGKVRRHIPDYLLITENGPVVVDVKPHHRLLDPVVACTFEWTRQAVEARRWRHEVWSEAREAELANLLFLAGFRRGWLFAPDLLDAVRSADLDGVPIGEAVRCVLPRQAEARVRAAIYHLLWRHELTTDLSEPLRPAGLLRGRV